MTLRHQENLQLLYFCFYILVLFTRSVEACVCKDRLTTEELAALWGYSLSSLTLWRQQGKLIEDGGTGSGRTPYYYCYPTIDKLHIQGLGEERQHLAPLIPSVAELVRYARETGKPALMASAEVMNELGITESRLRKDTTDGYIVAIQLPGSRKWLYPATGVVTYSERFAVGKSLWRPAGVTSDIVTLIIGLDINTLRAYCNGEKPELLRVTDVNNPGELIVTHQSLHQYLDRHLHVTHTGKPLLTPREWWLLRLLNKDALLSIRQIMDLYRLGRAKVTDAVNNGELPCLWTPGGVARIPAHAVEIWAALQ